MINKEIEKQFYEGKRSAVLPFIINDAVEILEGQHKGTCGSVISIEQLEPETKYLIELGDVSGDVVINAKSLKLAELTN